MKRTKYVEQKIVEDFSYGTGSTYTSPTLRRKYIKILLTCADKYATPAEIYPGIKNPLSHQLHDLCKNGYLAKYQKQGNRKNVYYRTTNKGITLIVQALVREMTD